MCPIKQTHFSAQTPSFPCFFLIEIIVNTNFIVPFPTVLSQLHSNYLVHSLAHSTNTTCHSSSVTPESFLPGTYFSKFWWQFRLHDTCVSGLTTRKISLSNILAVTYLPCAPPHQIITQTSMSWFLQLTAHAREQLNQGIQQLKSYRPSHQSG